MKYTRKSHTKNEIKYRFFGKEGNNGCSYTWGLLMLNGLIGNGEIFGGRMESGFMGNGLVRNKPSANVFESIEYYIQDPYLNNVVLHLKGDGANNSTNIVDSSPTPKSITRFGDTKISTAQSKYGGSSLYFDGNGDSLRLNSNVDFDFGSGNFTVEGWIYPLSFVGDIRASIIEYSNGTALNSNYSFLLRVTNTGQSLFRTIVGTTVYGDFAGTFSLNQWNYFAFVRNGVNCLVFINGILVFTFNMGSSSINTPDNRVLEIGANQGLYYLNAYIDSLRITKGVARYTANFNPETDTYLAY